MNPSYHLFRRGMVLIIVVLALATSRSVNAFTGRAAIPCDPSRAYYPIKNCLQFFTTQHDTSCYGITQSIQIPFGDILTFNPGLCCAFIPADMKLCVQQPKCLQSITLSPTTSATCATLSEKDLHGLSSGQLMDLNPGLDCASLSAGQNLCVKRASTSNVAAAIVPMTPECVYPYEWYKTKGNDTCASISDARGISMRNLAAQQDCRALTPGKPFCVPIFLPVINVVAPIRVNVSTAINSTLLFNSTIVNSLLPGGNSTASFNISSSSNLTLAGNFTSTMTFDATSTTTSSSTTTMDPVTSTKVTVVTEVPAVKSIPSRVLTSAPAPIPTTPPPAPRPAPKPSVVAIPPPPPPPPPSSGSGGSGPSWLIEHNSFRSKFGVPSLSVDSALINKAQNYARYLGDNNQWKHSGTGPENLYMSSVTTSFVAGIKAWEDEAPLYHNEKIPEGDFHAYGHFTQMIWRTAKVVGCGDYTAKSGNYYVVCHYDTGNIDGRTPYS